MIAFQSSPLELQCARLVTINTDKFFKIWNGFLKIQSNRFFNPVNTVNHFFKKLWKIYLLIPRVTDLGLDKEQLVDCQLTRAFGWLRQVAVLEEQKNEALEQVEDEAKPMETETDGVEPTSKSDGFEEKPDINDVPADESQVI